MILTDLRHKIKLLLGLLDRRDAYMAILIALVAIVAYILGILSGRDGGITPVMVLNTTNVASVDTNAVSTQKTPSGEGMYVASKSGTKYHLPTCSGAQRITEANKIWFATKAEAEKAGYTPAANCPGI